MTNSTGPDAPSDLQALAAVVHEWSAEQQASLERWKQSDLLPCPTLSWTSADGLEGEVGPTHGWESPAQYAVILSQTCDCVASGPGERHPFVQVSPAIDVTGINDQKWQSLVKGEMSDRFALAPVGLEGRWVADLRVSVPLRKEFLLDHNPVAGFGDERGALRFAEHLADKARRPALHSFLSDVMTPEIEKEVSRALKSQDSGWCDKVSEICFLIRGSRLAPTGVQLLILTDDPVTPNERKRWVALSDAFKTRGKAKGIEVRRPKVATVVECSAAVYRPSVPLRIRALGPERTLAQPPL
jgi:hypothetical protein